MPVSHSTFHPSQFGDLRAFCLVVELGSISQTAREMGETKGSISRRLTRLERDLGVALVLRGTRPIAMTEAGRTYRAYAQDTLRTLSRGATALHEGSAPSGALRLSCTHGIGLCLLAPLVLDFRNRYPEIALEVILTDDAPNFATLQLDMAIYPARQLPDSTLIARKLFDWEMQIVASPSYLKSAGKRLSPEDLVHHSVVFGAAATRTPSRKLRIHMPHSKSPTEITLPEALLTTSTAFAYAAALSNAGIGVVPDCMVRDDIREGRLVEVFKGASTGLKPGGLYLLFPRLSFTPPAVKALRDFLTESLTPAGTEARNPPA